MTDVTHCPNCGTVWPEGAEVCPHCGFVSPNVPVWPPPPEGRGPLPLAPAAPRLVTGKAWGDMALGVVVSLGANVFFGLGLIVMPILYFVLRRRFPVFARGIGYGFLGTAVLFLGALGWCFYSLFGPQGHGI